MKKIVHVLVIAVAIMLVGSFYNQAEAEDYYLTVDSNGNSAYLITETIQFKPFVYKEDGIGIYSCNVKVVPPYSDSFTVDNYKINFGQSLTFEKNGTNYGLRKSSEVASNSNSVEMKLVSYLKSYHMAQGRGNSILFY